MKNKLSLEELQKELVEVISQLKETGGYVEVIENHHTAAVILNTVDFKRVQRFLPKRSSPKKKPEKEWRLQGSMELVGDIEEASAEISKSILESIEKQEL